MIKLLKELASIISGFSLKLASDGTDSKNIIVQARDISGNLYIDKNTCKVTNLDKIPERAILEENDVVIAERGTLNAGVVGQDLKGAIASSSVFIIRPNKTGVDPAYLASYFNSPKGRKYLLRLAEGSLIKNISKKQLSEIPIYVPDLETQKIIVDMNTNKQRQLELLERKKQLVGQVVESAIKQILDNKNN